MSCAAAALLSSAESSFSKPYLKGGSAAQNPIPLPSSEEELGTDGGVKKQSRATFSGRGKVGRQAPKSASILVQEASPSMVSVRGGCRVLKLLLLRSDQSRHDVVKMLLLLALFGCRRDSAAEFPRVR